MHTQSCHTTSLAPVLLKDYVDRFMLYTFNGEGELFFFPEGQFDLILQTDQTILYRTDDQQNWITRPNYFIGGLHSRCYKVKTLGPKTRLISIKFRPDCAKYFIPDRLDLYKNRITDLAEILHGSQLNRLEELASELDHPSLIHQLEVFLLALFRDRGHSPVEGALEMLRNSHGTAHIHQLASAACLSPSQFRRRFREEIGMSPKEYSKVLRINAITRQLRQGTAGRSFSELAQELGYFDQSHLIKDFRFVTGTSPKKFLARWKGEDHFSMQL